MAVCRCPLWRVRGARHGKRGAGASTDLVVKGRREVTDVGRDDTMLLPSPAHTSGTMGPSLQQPGRQRSVDASLEKRAASHDHAI